MVGVKADSGAHAIIKETGDVLPSTCSVKITVVRRLRFSNRWSTRAIRLAASRSKTARRASRCWRMRRRGWECKLVNTVEGADHSIFIGEVTEAGVRQEPDGRADNAILWMKDLGDRVFYGG